MKEVLVVRHSVGGRTLIHTEQQPMEYAVTRDGQGWRITLIITQEVNDGKNSNIRIRTYW